MKKTAYEFDLVNNSNVDADYDFYLRVPFTSDLPLGSIKYNLVKDGANITDKPAFLASTIIEDTAEDNSGSNLEGTSYQKHPSSVKKLDNTTYGGVSTGPVVENVGVGHILAKEELDPEFAETEYRLYENSASGMTEVATFAPGEVMYTCRSMQLNNVEYLGVIDANGKFTNKYILAALYHKDSDRQMISNVDDTGVEEYYLAYKLDTATIKKNSTSHYKLNMWIDYNAGNDAIGKTFEAKAFINATQKPVE